MEPKCNLIIDSCCDLPFEIVDREWVELIKFPYFFGDEEFLDDLWQSSKPRDFYDKMRKGKQPTTAQASLVILRDKMEHAAKLGKPTVYLCFTSGLSASFDQACMMADQIRSEYPDFELYVVDTLLASTGEALLVLEALRQQERGLTAKEMADWAEEARNFINVYFMVEDLESLHRGGRIPNSVAVVGAKLDVKPILTIPADGTIAVKGVARGRKKGLKQLAQMYFDRVDQSASSYVCVGNADCEKDMKRLEEIIAKEGYTPVFVEGTIGPVIGSHVGPGMVSLVFWGPDKRETLSVADRIARKVRGKN